MQNPPQPAVPELRSLPMTDWNQRLEEQRESEWQARCELLAIARKIIQSWDLDDFDKVPPDLALKFVSASSEMGRLAIEGVKDIPASAAERISLMSEIAASIEQVRGKGDEGLETRDQELADRLA